MLDINDPRVIRFLNESYTKENRLRLKWFRTNREKLLQAAGEGRTMKDIDVLDVIAASMLPGVEMLRVAHRESAENRRAVPIRDTKDIQGIEAIKKTHTIRSVGLEGSPDPRLDRADTELRPDPLMRPVPPHLTDVLYKGIPDYGRVQYLRGRTAARPEDKYYFAECLSWEHGWRLRDSQLPALTRATRGRRCALAREAAASVGPQPDPPHYAPPAAAANFCSVIDQ